MKILIPILSETENDEAFIDKAVAGAKEVILLLIVDASPKEKFGFTTSFIQKARHIMEEVKKAVGKKRKPCEDILEWGDTMNKIVNIALLRKTDKVCLKAQDNQYFKDLLKRLKDEKIETEVIGSGSETAKESGAK
ncbi:MAG TPA: universal stress protein [Candidatus Diapherotrites archaeon]|uniref:Universal stress protein n=1 Tax=Candidatus Iainarchaeum sp. TaxID=3101447 RepID=A0A7J4IVI2_9ARCH|nr:universal stress protein [Candidatus Diapherotrites archaeon]